MVLHFASGMREGESSCSRTEPCMVCFITVVKVGKSKGMVLERLRDPPVCKDPALLTTHAMGVNIFKQGPEVALKPDSEYPAWLFQMDLGSPKKLEELDPETKYYWRRLRKENIWRHNRLSKNKKF
uniref:Large ribosomal subunit protein mL54 n=1 Tax=Ornithorhynchus anatinus TaxID=9258 RepID=A0A6I8N4I0_ORNAN